MDRSPERDSPATQTNNAPGTFLIVEDEQLVLRLLEKVLLDHGSKVFTAADGEEAIAVYRRHKQEINVVLLDMGLPKIAGWEVLLEMKKENPDVCAVIATGYLKPEAKTKLYRAGVKHFVNKPYMPENVVEILQSLVEQRSKII